MTAFLLLPMLERPRGAAPIPPRPYTAALPVCHLDLAAAAGLLVCGSRHSFDLARDGYVNLLDGRRRSLMAGGDSAEQLDHRTAFLEAGHFNPVGAAIAAHVTRADPTSPAGAGACSMRAAAPAIISPASRRRCERQ